MSRAVSAVQPQSTMKAISSTRPRTSSWTALRLASGAAMPRPMIRAASRVGRRVLVTSSRQKPSRRAINRRTVNTSA
jgi:hypothetical protein